MMGQEQHLEWRDFEALRVPFINGLPLCSLRNPQREAEKWKSLQKACEQILVIGVGAGFHLQFSQDAQVLVFDPCPELVDVALERCPELSGKITSSEAVLIQYLEKLPAIWIFRPAFNGRMGQWSEIEKFIHVQEVLIGQLILSDAKLTAISKVWSQFDHRSFKFGIYDMAEMRKNSLSDQELFRIDILRELVR